MNPHITALLIPIIAIVFSLSIPIIAIITGYFRKKQVFELYHQERMAAISKGIDLPPLPDGLLADGPATRRSPKDTLRKGLVGLFLGIALYFALPGPTSREEMKMLGLIPAAIGLANLVYYLVAGRHEPEIPVKTSETKTERPV
jgi:hypothetical protein